MTDEEGFLSRLAELRVLHERRLRELSGGCQEGEVKSEEGDETALAAQRQAERYNLDILGFHEQRAAEGRPVLSPSGLGRLLRRTPSPPPPSRSLGAVSFSDLGDEDEDHDDQDEEEGVKEESHVQLETQEHRTPKKAVGAGVTKTKEEKDGTTWMYVYDAPGSAPVGARREVRRRETSVRPFSFDSPKKGDGQGQGPAGEKRLSRRVMQDLAEMREEEERRARPFKASPVPDFVRRRRLSCADSRRAGEASPTKSTPNKQHPSTPQGWVKYYKTEAPNSAPVSPAESFAGRPFKANPVPAYVRERSDQGGRRKSDLPPKPPFRPSINPTVPDFATLHAMQAARANRAALEFVPTIPEEFHLHGAGSAEDREASLARVVEDIERDQDRLPETRWPFMAPRAPLQRSDVCSAIAPPPRRSKSNLATELRAAVVRTSLADQRQKERDERRAARDKAAREKDIARRLSQRLSTHGGSQVDALQRERRMRDAVQDMKVADEQYQRDLEQRLSQLEDSRLFLFERDRAEEARRKAEIEFDKSVGGTGLSPEQFRESTAPKIKRLLQDGAASGAPSPLRSSSLPRHRSPPEEDSGQPKAQEGPDDEDVQQSEEEEEEQEEEVEEEEPDEYDEQFEEDDKGDDSDGSAGR